VGRGIISFSLPDITSRDKQNWAMANKTHLNWRNKKMQKPKKNPVKLRVGLKTYMSIGWWITQQQEQQQKRTPTAVRLARKLHLERPPTDPKGHIKEALAFKP
jgi:hypothetical protein